VRILLTGYSDLAAIVGSINDGEVYRFISKPWDSTEIQRTLAEAASIAFALAEMPPRPAEAAAPIDEALMVVDGNDNVYRAVRELYAGTCKVLYAKDLDEALTLMQTTPVAVILADIESGRPETTALYKLLKQEHPEILTIVMTTASDSEVVIELINQAQIFRFLNKPVNLKVLQGHVQAALARYRAFKAQPALAAQQKVEVPGGLAASPEAQSLLGRIRAASARWFGPAGKD
jgi:serine/threonine-protein kinase